MKMHNMLFIILGVVGLLLIGAGQVLIKTSVTEVPRHARATIGPNIPDLSLGGSLNNVFGARGMTMRQTDSTQKTIGILVALIAHVLVAVGAGVYAVGKGRSPWFGLLGLLTPIGLLFLAVLEEKTVTKDAMA